MEVGVATDKEEIFKRFLSILVSLRKFREKCMLQKRVLIVTTAEIIQLYVRGGCLL